MSSIILKRIVIPPGGTQLTGDALIRNFSNEISGRFYLTTTYAPQILGWQAISAASMGLASDASPSINAAVTNTQSPTTLSYNPSTGYFYLPKTGSYNFNISCQYVRLDSATQNYEWRLVTISSPQWTSLAGVTYPAKSYTNNPIGTASAQLATTPLITINESGLSYTGIFPAGTLIAPYLYITSTAASQSGSTPLSFPSGGIIMEVKLLQQMA